MEYMTTWRCDTQDILPSSKMTLCRLGFGQTIILQRYHPADEMEEKVSFHYLAFFQALAQAHTAAEFLSSLQSKSVLHHYNGIAYYTIALSPHYSYHCLEIGNLCIGPLHLMKNGMAPQVSTPVSTSNQSTPRQTTPGQNSPPDTVGKGSPSLTVEHSSQSTSALQREQRKVARERHR